MSKTKKIATAVVSIVLASTMCASLAACKDKGTSGQALLTVSTDSDGNLYWSSGTSLNLNMGYSSTLRTSFTTSMIAEGTTITLLDGKDYTAGSMRPAWSALESLLDLSFTDSFTAYDSTAQIETAITDKKLGQYALITGDSSTIVNYGSASNAFLDLSLYLDYMPNFKYFLEQNPVVYMSLTSNATTGAMYYAPYFDGNDDIEKYELANQTWVVTLLDNDEEGSTTTFEEQAAAKSNGSSYDTSTTTVGTSASVESYMGTTGSWWVQTTAEDGETVTKVVVNYDAALAAAKDGNTALGKALTAAGVTIGDLTSGNIVDLQNAAINATNGTVTGAQLLNILRAYIDVAYQTESGSSFYGNTRSNVFNGYSAAWDVDLLVAFSRCLVTNVDKLDIAGAAGSVDAELVYAISARASGMQRQNDVVSLAGELYGVRGLTSRYEYTYVDSDGTLQDAREDEDMWTALDNMNKMAKEGLLYTGTSQTADKTSYYTSKTSPISFMIYDYVQTQTANGGFAAQGVTEISGVDEDNYNFGPINTPVSLWNDGDTSTAANSDGISYDYSGDSKYMRFTESWRSVKNTGFAIPYDYVKNSPEKLSACLAVIDYMFSNDGQILMTYGQMSSNNDITENPDGTYTANTDGWWYAKEQTGVNLTDVAELVPGSDQYTVKDEYASQYFIYQNKVYTGTLYKGEQQPIMTTANLYFFYGYTVNGIQLAMGDLEKFVGKLSYTNYARNVIGSAQPMGNKLQSFEFQCTAQVGLNGGNKVAVSLVNGTISHVSVDPDNDKGLWYFIVPTTLPYSSADASAINTTFNTLINTVFSASSSSSTNYCWDIIKYGLGSGNNVTYGVDSFTIATSAANSIEILNSRYKMNTYETSYMQEAFSDILEYYNTVIKTGD